MRCRPCGIGIIFFFSLLAIIFNTLRLDNKMVESKQKIDKLPLSSMGEPTRNILEVHTSLRPNGYTAVPTNNSLQLQWRLPTSKTKKRPSVVFSDCTGRLGNQISTYAILLVFHKMYGFTPHLNKLQIDLLSQYFVNVNFAMFRRKIPKHLVRIELDYQFDKLKNSSYNTGFAINIGKYPHSLTLYRKYLPEINQKLKLKKKYVDEAKAILFKIAKNYTGSNITFIGIHVRRNDYQKWMTKRLGKKIQYVNETYFNKGMDIFRKRFENPGVAVFVAVSDDEGWIEEHLGHQQNVHIGGKVLKTASKNPSGRDFALLSQCNHSLLSYGTFGQWAALRNGGQVILPTETRRLSREMVNPVAWAKTNFTNWSFI